MVHYSKVISGIVRYIDADILAKLNGSAAKWAAGAAIAIAARRAEQIYHEITKSPVVAALGLVDGENVDIDTIYAEVLKQAQQGSATISLPLIGPITFGVADVESVYRYIKGA